MAEPAPYSVQQPVPNTNSTTSSNPIFKAPAHKHAHHLHDIPPKEKSTRTLIIDHLLWVHGRTRFAQARAELGMTDPTGGLSNTNYKHRERPEEYEEDEVVSEGEDVIILGARTSDPRGDREAEKLRFQDLGLARTLRLRAESLEKVVTSMLNQPPPIHPVVEDMTASPPTSPKISPSAGDSAHPHTLPEGVRLRLAMATLINDLFARQATPPPSNLASQVILPSVLEPLKVVSACNATESDTGYITKAIKRKIPLKPGSRTQILYMSGADPNTANSPPALRCPRHLHTGCEICVSSKSGTRPGQSQIILGEGGITGWRDGSGIGSGLAPPGIKGSVLRRKGTSITGAGGTQLSELIPRFLRLSALIAAELGLEIRDKEEKENAIDAKVPVWQASHAEPQLQDLTPLPAPSSQATVRAISQAQQDQDQMVNYALRPSREWYMLLAGLLTRAALEGYLIAGWRGSDPIECLMTCGMGIREPVHPPVRNKGDTAVTEEEYAEFDPDDFPTLVEAVQVLFPATRGETVPAQEEFELEMDERLRRFYDIPASTHDLSTHMEDLTWQYPAEPVERAAVRFCEAMARWRGKPDLENCRKRNPNSVGYADDTQKKPAIGLKPQIDRYFSVPASAPETSRNWNKRTRNTEAMGPSKRVHV